MNNCIVLVSKKLKLLLIFLIACTSALFVFQYTHNSSNFKETLVPTTKANTDNNADDSNFNILKFWNQEIVRVNNTQLNVKLLNIEKVKYENPSTKKEFEFSYQELEFQSLNYFGSERATITLHGYLLFPEDIREKNPGCLFMHGLGNNAESFKEYTYPLLEDGFVVLCYSHPGHGKSEGEEPKPENFFYDGNYNEEAHCYLTLCGAIQGLRLLESHDCVDNNKIIVSGSSYGGLNTMWLASICGNRIAGAIPFIAIGDLETTLEDPTKLMFWLWGENAEEVEADDDFWDNQNLRFDPIYYLRSHQLPPILWIIGTNDEFFNYHSISGTLEAVQNKKEAFLRIIPDGHHEFPGFDESTFYFIDYIINGGSSPPKTTLNYQKRINSIFGEHLKIEIEVESDDEIKSVQVCYKYVDIVGSCWNIMDIKKSGKDFWSATINPSLITSKIDYYIIVNIKGDKEIWFTSENLPSRELRSNFTVIAYIFLIALISIPAIWLLGRRFAKIENKLEGVNKTEAKKKLLIELALIFASEFTFFVSLTLPQIVFEESGMIWNSLYVFKNVFTWKSQFGIISPFLTSIFFIIWIIAFYLSLTKPISSSLLKLIYPVLIIFMITLFFGPMNDPSTIFGNFGKVNMGIGVYLMVLSSFLIMVISIWKRRYQNRLGIVTRKRKALWFRKKESRMVG
ncbi:MAG: alpha/beta fold hydrolase [Candidatus Lokiarchaeota archaeon]|nr:alpha/beta fold hydrolase [Candidatus Lokiarchaeota archaeon]